MIFKMLDGKLKRAIILLFCLLVLTFLFVFPALANEEASSIVAPKGFQAVPTAEKLAKSPAEVLLIQDFAPWGLNANEAVLTEFGITYDLINSAQLAVHDLSGYKFIMYASDQPTSYYQNIDANLAKIEAYVSAGGLLLAHSCDQGWNTGDWHGLNILPGNVAHLNFVDGWQYGSNVIKILDPAHGVVVGDGTFILTDAYLAGWNWSTHGVFTGLLPGTSTVMVSNDGSGDGSTYIDYNYGSGKVLANMQTIEWGYGMIGRPELLRNEIRFAQQWQAAGSPYGKVVGNGQIEVGTSLASFVFDVLRRPDMPEPKGLLIYLDRDAKVKISSKKITALAINHPDKKAAFGGTCTFIKGAQKEEATFKVVIGDNNGAGKDTFEIVVRDKNSNLIYQAGGPVVKGDIKILP